MKKRVDEMYDYYEGQVSQYGMNMNSYLAMQNMSVEDFRNQLADQALASAQGDVLFEEVAKLENIKLEDGEVEHELNLYKNYYNIPDDQFEEFKKTRKDDIASDILRRETALFLIDNNN